MAIEAYGSITITDLMDIATYIYYSATGSSTASEWHINPSSDDKYIGFYNGSPVDSGQPATPTATIMSNLKVSEYVGSDGISIIDSVQVYYFKTSNPSIAPSSIPSGSVVSYVGIDSGKWTKSIPQYYPGGVYWTSIQNFYSSGTPSVKSTTPQRDQALTDSCGVSYAASSLADEVNNRTRYFWNDNNGTHMAAGISSVTFDTAQSSTWGYNTRVAANNLTMGYNDKVGVSLTSSSLNFYKWSGNSQIQTAKFGNDNIILGNSNSYNTTITSSSLTMGYGSNTGISLSSSSLNFYKWSGNSQIQTASFGEEVTIGQGGEGQVYCNDDGIKVKLENTPILDVSVSGEGESIQIEKEPENSYLIGWTTDTPIGVVGSFTMTESNIQGIKVEIVDFLHNSSKGFKTLDSVNSSFSIYGVKVVWDSGTKTLTVTKISDVRGEYYVYVSTYFTSGTKSAPLFTFGNRRIEIDEQGNQVNQGSYSSTFGLELSATGKYSHAEGQSTTASGKTSHAEGWGSVASGEASHAEGAITTAIEEYSHAEGISTTASGRASHAEGWGSVASGEASHAEGIDTIAASHYQTAIGKHNREDTSNTYAFIIGNGTLSSNRSNALTVDWYGDVGYAGYLSPMTADKYIDDKTVSSNSVTGGAINLKNGDMSRINCLYFNDASNGRDDSAIKWPYTDASAGTTQTWDSLWAVGGDLKFAPNNGTAQTVWHTGNLISEAVTISKKTITGVTGNSSSITAYKCGKVVSVDITIVLTATISDQTQFGTGFPAPVATVRTQELIASSTTYSRPLRFILNTNGTLDIRYGVAGTYYHHFTYISS